MKDTVAIVGSHPRTSREFDFDRNDCDIWVFNEALNTEWCKRADGVFQIHAPVIFRSATNRNDPKHYEWLQSGETPVIFMQDKYSDIPKSEKFPLMEIFDQYPQAEKYFTSSVAYALALAIYKGYKFVEVYGVEMETNTEYGHQRVGVAYWCGLAAGQGIYVDFHSPTFFESPLYGYEGNLMIPLDHYRERISQSEPHILGVRGAIENVEMMIEDALDEFIKTYKADLSELDSMIHGLGQNYVIKGALEGAKDINTHYLEKCEKMLEESETYLIVRQEYESEYQHAVKSMKKAKGMLDMADGMLAEHRVKLNTNDSKNVREKLVEKLNELLKNFTHATYHMGRFNGVAKENRILMAKYDEMLDASGVTADEAVQITQPEGVVE